MAMANATLCEDVCGLCLIMDGRVRTGPSLCYQDYYLAPLYAVSIGALLVYRAKSLRRMTPTSEHQKFWEKKDFILTVVLVLHSLYGFVNVGGGDIAEDNTVRHPRTACRYACVFFACHHSLPRRKKAVCYRMYVSPCSSSANLTLFW